MCASDHKTLSYFLFFGCIFFNAREREREKSNHLFSTKKEKKRAATFLFFFVRVVLFGLFVGCLFDSRHFFPLPLPHPSSSDSFDGSSSSSSSTTTKTTKYLSFARIYRRSLFEREKALSRERKERTGKEKLYSKKVRIWHF